MFSFEGLCHISFCNVANCNPLQAKRWLSILLSRPAETKQLARNQLRITVIMVIILTTVTYLCLSDIWAEREATPRYKDITSYH